MPQRESASARRHAQAAYELARESSQVDQWVKDLDGIAAIFQDPALKALLESPRIPLEGKLRVLRENLAGVNPLALNLALLLVAKGRIRLAPAIASEFERLVDARRGYERAEVVSAIPLDSAQQERITNYLSRLTGKRIRLTARVDPSIGGGLTARIGDQILDGSIRAKLQELRKSLMAGAQS